MQILTLYVHIIPEEVIYRNYGLRRHIIGNVENVYCFPGGTEATNLINAIDAIERVRFSLKNTNSLNPTYHVFIQMIIFQLIIKIYYDPPNPNTNFIAVMTCGDANEVVGC